MARNIRLYLEDILESIDTIQKYTTEYTEEKFKSDPVMQDAVIRRLEVIGEAAKHVPQELRDQYQTVPWQQISGMRDVLIHEYFGVNIKRAWKVIEKDLLPLQKNVQLILDQIKD